VATIYVGPTAAGAANGTSWANRYGSLTAAEDRPVAAGDFVWVGAGVYRELLTVDVSGGAGASITYTGDVTGEHTDGVGGLVRVTGSDNDTTTARNNCITSNGKNYRTFQNMHFDMAAQSALNIIGNPTNWIIQDFTLNGCPTSGSPAIYFEGTGKTIVVRRGRLSGARARCLHFWSGVNNDNSASLVENCIMQSEHNGTGVYDVNWGGVIVNNCAVRGGYVGVWVETAMGAGQCLTVQHSVISNCHYGIWVSTLGYVVEDYNAFSNNGTNRTNVAVGAHSNIYPPLFDLGILQAGYPRPWPFGALSQYSALRAIAGNGAEATDDLNGITKPPNSAQKSWGAMQWTPISQDTVTVYAPGNSHKLSDAGACLLYVPTTAVSTTISVRVYREANYAGTNPQMIVRQPGQVDVTVTDAGAASAWNLLTTTLTPAALPGFVVIELRSLNTAAAGSYATYFDALTVA
jgi:hypothetical protein